mgnify:CR=1 FL=1
MPKVKDQTEEIVYTTLIVSPVTFNLLAILINQSQWQFNELKVRLKCINILYQNVIITENFDKIKRKHLLDYQ